MPIGYAFPSSDAITLEEGTWTPSLGGNTTYTAQSGNYTKIGKMVFLNGSIAVTAIGTGSTYVISGMPFVSGTGYWGLSVGYSISLATAVVSMELVTTGGTTMYVFSRTAANVSSAANPIFGNGTQLFFSGCFMTA